MKRKATFVDVDSIPAYRIFVESVGFLYSDFITNGIKLGFDDPIEDFDDYRALAEESFNMGVSPREFTITDALEKM